MARLPAGVPELVREFIGIPPDPAGPAGLPFHFNFINLARDPIFINQILPVNAAYLHLPFRQNGVDQAPPRMLVSRGPN